MTENENEEREEPLAGLDERARKEVEKANSEAAGRRHELADVKKTLAEREAELQELRESVAPRLLEADIAIAAAGRLRDPQDAMGLLPRDTLDSLLAAEDTTERRRLAEEAIEKLLDAKPYLAANGRTGGGLVTQGPRSAGEPRPGKSPDDWLRERARR